MYKILYKGKREIYANRDNIKGEYVHFDPKVDGKLSVYDCATGKPIMFFSRPAGWEEFGHPCDTRGVYLVCPRVDKSLLSKWRVWWESFCYGAYTISASPVYPDHFRVIGTVELMIVKEKSDKE